MLDKNGQLIVPGFYGFHLPLAVRYCSHDGAPVFVSHAFDGFMDFREKVLTQDNARNLLRLIDPKVLYNSLYEFLYTLRCFRNCAPGFIETFSSGLNLSENVGLMFGDLVVGILVPHLEQILEATQVYSPPEGPVLSISSKK